MGWQDAPLIDAAPAKPAWQAAPVVDTPKPKPSLLDRTLEGAGNAAKGVASGVADLGDTILGAANSSTMRANPIIGLARAIIDQVSPNHLENAERERAASQESFNQDHADSTAFNVGRVAGNVAVTLPVSGALGAAAKAVGAPAALSTSIASGGFRTGMPAATTLGKAADLAVRAAGGAATGGTSAALVNPESAGTGALIGAVVPGLAKGAGLAMDKVGGATVRNAPASNATQKMAVARTGADAGYVIPPVDLPQAGIMTKLLSGLSGKIKTSQVASQRNQAVTDKLARSALGLDEGAELTADVLQSMRQKAGGAYEVVRGAGNVAADPAFTSRLDQIAAVSKGASRSFPGLPSNGVEDLIAAVRQPSFDAGDGVDAIVMLRDTADGAFRKGDNTLGRAAKAAATALEDQLERHLSTIGNPDAVKAFQAARQQIAKTYSVQKALNPATGNVAAPRLAKELEKGRPLSGELRQIGEFSQAFPKATQALKEAPGTVSPLDWFWSSTAGLGAASPTMAAATLVGRPLVRSALLSGPAQRAALRERVPSAAFDQLMELALPLTGRALPVLAASP